MRGGADNPQSVDLEGNRNLIEAARAAGVEHFIFVSLLGADVNNPSPFVQAKAQSESALRESGMEYTILAPTAFMEVWPAMVVGMPILQGRSVTLVGEGRRRHSFVSNRDVAAFSVAAADRPEARKQYLALGGLESLSWREVVATYERVLGRSIPVEFVELGEPIPGLPDPMPALLSGMETYDSVVEMEETSSNFDVPLTSLETFVREQIASQSA
jgi:NADH dehydrogenase